MAIKQDYIHEWEIDGHKLKARVSPCVWMYAGHVLQIQIELEEGGSASMQDKTVTWENTTEQHIIDLCNKVKLVPCKTCGKPAFDPSVVSTNREGECEDCFIKAIRKRLDEAQAREIAKIAQRDKRKLKEGYTHRVTAWIHPDRGDDYQMDIYWGKKPTKAMIQRELQKAGSRVLDDYQVFDLVEVTQKKQ